MQVREVAFNPHGDNRGQLIAIESFGDIDFEIKRVYYIYRNTDSVRRGFHAHFNLKQLLVCVNGSCKIHVDDGFETKEYLLDDPSKGIIIEGKVWREMYDFSEGCVLLVLASEHYDEKDYIRDYDAFIDLVKKEK